MAKKVMQIDVYEDGSVRVLDAVKTEAIHKPSEAEKTTWKKFHGYLKENEEKESVAEEQFTLIVTNPCAWLKIGNAWRYVCW